jgi:hypothetical protein
MEVRLSLFGSDRDRKFYDKCEGMLEATNIISYHLPTAQICFKLCLSTKCVPQILVGGIVVEHTGRLGNCLERVSISITPIAWIGLC